MATSVRQIRGGTMRRTVRSWLYGQVGGTFAVSFGTYTTVPVVFNLYKSALRSVWGYDIAPVQETVLLHIVYNDVTNNLFCESN